MDENYLIIEREMNKIKKDFLENIKNYKAHLNKSMLNAPIEILCLDNATLNILRRNNIFRIFDLSAADLTKIKGLGNARIMKIESRLNEFISM